MIVMEFPLLVIHVLLMLDSVFCEKDGPVRFSIPKSEASEFIRVPRNIFHRMFAQKTRCYTKRLCKDFEEFKEMAENEYDKEFLLSQDTQQKYESLYRECHYQNPWCFKEKQKCKCNVQMVSYRIVCRKSVGHFY